MGLRISPLRLYYAMLRKIWHFVWEPDSIFSSTIIVIDKLQVMESSQHRPLCFLFSCDSDNDFVTLLREQRVKDVS